MNKWKWILCLFAFNSKNGNTQSYVTTPQVNLSQSAPVAPNAGSLSKYFEIPVNMASGIPGIQIPLYTIQTGNIKIPIVLSYHAGGIKINDDAGWVGMNWSLSAGATISKRANGFDDIYTAEQSTNNGPQFNYVNPDYPNYFYLTGLNSITDIVDSMWVRGADTMTAFIGRMASGYVDGEADEYFFNTPEGGGCTIYNQKTQEYQNKKLDGWIGTYAVNGNHYWGLTSKSGLQYSFTNIEYIQNPIWYSWAHGGDYHPQTQYIPNTWLVTTISDPVNNKGVAYSYENHYQDEIIKGYSDFVDYAYINGYMNTIVGGGSQPLARKGDELSITRINFDEGRVDFVKDTARRDGVTPPLKELKIYNADSILLKKFLFKYFYPKGVISSDSSSRIFLLSLQEINYSLNGDSSLSPAYKFDYDTSIHLPYKYSNGQDYWGYYNGKNSNTDQFPTLAALTAWGVPTHSDKKVDTAYTRAGILKKIIYPTGGSLKFEYENNRITNDTTYVGGLRIKRITNYDSVANKSLVKEYGYQNGEVRFQPTFHYFFIHQGDGYGSTTYRVRLSGNPIYPLFPSNGSPVVYTAVTEKQVGGSEEIQTKHYFTGFDFHIGYYTDGGPGVPYPKIPIPEDFVGLEYKTEIYKRNPNSTQTLIQMDSSIYSYISDPSKHIWNVQAAWSSPAGGSDFFVWPSNDPFNQDPHGIPVYGAPSSHFYKDLPEAPIKTESYSKYYDGLNTLIQPSFYTYDSTNGNIKEIKSITSTGDTTIKLVKYACEFLHTGANSGINQQIDLLKDYNILTAPIEVITLFKKKDSTNSIVLDAVLYEYDNLKPKKVYKVYEKLPFSSFNVAYNNSNDFYKDSHYAAYQEVTAFDADKNPVTVVTEGNKESYIWDGENITARTVNAVSEETAYTSFETSQKGHWTYSGSTGSSYFLNGKKSYSLNGGNISISSISNIPYVVSYWSMNGSQNVNSSAADSGRAMGSWKYYEHSVTPTSGTVTVSGNGTIDELRLYPKGSLMSTFTFSPLLGMTSQCDINNRVTYYQYDGMNRLSLIRDQDYNILKRICYSYAGQVENCAMCSDTCTGPSKRCVNGVCQTGTKVYLSALLKNGVWACTYVYLFPGCILSEQFSEFLGSAPMLWDPC